MNVDEFYLKAAGFAPNPLQRSVWDAYGGGPEPALLVRAGTGTGKSEAVLLPALADDSGRRVILVLPSKALIEDMGRRVVKICESLTKGTGRTLAVTIDMGGSCRRTLCRDGGSRSQTYLRHLFADDVIITTLDKFLFRLFGYGEKIKSFIFAHRVFGSAIEKRPFVIFDEAHDYDGPAFTNFEKLLHALYLKGKAVCVMSATLPKSFSGFLDVIDAMDGNLASEQALYQREQLKMIHPAKRLVLVSAPNTATAPGHREEFLRVMEMEARERHDPRKRIIVRCESVRGLIDLHGRLADLDPFVYHGRLTASRRRTVIGELTRRQESDQGFLVLATSAIEAGCDLDAHVVVTELCNPDSLVQLAGRLNRRCLMENAELVVVGDGIRAYTCSIGGKEEQERYIEDLRAMGGVFVPGLLDAYFTPARGNWMSEVLFDMLWDYVFEGDLTCKPLWDRGILITRSWEPSVTLCTGLDPVTKRPENPVQVGIGRLVPRISGPTEELKGKNAAESGLAIESDGEWHAELKRIFFNLERGEGNRLSLYPFNRHGLSGYETNLLCVIGEKFKGLYFDEVLGYKEIPRVLMRGYQRGFERTLFQPKIEKSRIVFENKYPKQAGSLWLLERKDAGNSNH